MRFPPYYVTAMPETVQHVTLNEQTNMETIVSRFTHMTAHRITILATLFLIIGSALAQPIIVVDPEQFEFDLPFGNSRNGVIDVANDGDSMLFVTMTQEAVEQRDAQLNILAWIRYTDVNEEWRNMQESLQAIEIDYNITEFTSENPDDWEQLLQETDVLIIPDPENAYVVDLQRLGERLFEVLTDFVEGGGYVVVTDFAGGSAGFLNSTGLLAIDYPPERSNERVQCESVGFHVLNSEVREYSAYAGNNLHEALDDDAFAVTVSVEGGRNNITAREVGDGGVVYFGLDWREYNREMTSLLVNAVMWVKGGSSWLTFESFSGEIEPEDSEDLLFTVNSALAPELGEFERRIVLLSNDPDQPVIRIPVNLIVTEAIPVELTIEPSQLFMIGEADRDTSHVIIVRNLSEGSVEASVELEDINQRWLTINRDNLVIGPRLTDRLLLEFNADGAEDGLNVNRILINFDNPEPTTIVIPVRYYTGDSFGSVEGYVHDAEDGSGIADAVMNLYGLTTTSGGDGEYRLDGVPPGRFQLTATHPDFLEWVSEPFNVTADEVAEVTGEMTYTVMNLSFDREVDVRIIADDMQRIEGFIRNEGTGLLRYTTRFAELNPPQFMPRMQNRLTIESGEQLHADQIFGATFHANRFYLSGSPGFQQQERIYILNRDGEPISSFEQPIEHTLGMSGLVHNGDLLFGSGEDEIIGIDLDGEVRLRIGSPIPYSRALTFDDDEQLFWLANAGSSIYAINFDGEIVYELDNPDLAIYGLAWHGRDPDGYDLYIMSRDGEIQAQISRMNVETGDVRYVHNVARGALERGGGITISKQWDPRRWTLITQLTGGDNRTKLLNLSVASEWAKMMPTAGELEPDEEMEVFLDFDASGFSGGERLQGLFSIEGNQRGGYETINIDLRVLAADQAVSDDVNLLPFEIGLTAHPNPFNSTLRIRYRAPDGEPFGITLFDVQGRVAVELIDPEEKRESVGSIALNGANLSAGIYFVVIKTAEMKIVQRVVLLK